MFIDVVDLRNFYAQSLGIVARRFVGRGIRAHWPDTRGERIAGIVANWPTGVVARRAEALGARAETSFEDIIGQYIADHERHPTALKGLKELG